MTMRSPVMTEEKKDALMELLNIGVGRAAGMLNQMTSHQISLRVPSIELVTLDDLGEAMNGREGDVLASVKMDFSGTFSGTAALIFPTTSAALLVSYLTDEEPGTPDLDAVRAVTLTEVGNIVVNCVMGSITNMLSEQVMYSLPTYQEGSITALVSSDGKTIDEWVLLVQTRFSIEQLHIEGDIVLVLEVGSLDALFNGIDRLNTGPVE
jgi:chemotaxis protein CheC